MCGLGLCFQCKMSACRRVPHMHLLRADEGRELRAHQHEIPGHGVCSRHQAAAVTCGGDDGRSPDASSPLAARCWIVSPSYSSAGWFCACWQSRSHHRDTRSPARLQQGTCCGFSVSWAALDCSIYLQHALACLYRGQADKRSPEDPGGAMLHTKRSGKPLLPSTQSHCRQTSGRRR